MMPFRDGISIIATPELAASELSLFDHFLDVPFPDVSNTMNASDTLYEIKDIPLKGKGAVATRKIAKEQIIMVDHAIILSPTEYPKDMPRESIQDILHRGAEQLRDPRRVFELDQKGTPGASVVEDVLNTNSFALSISGVPYTGLFPELSVSQREEIERKG